MPITTPYELTRYTGNGVTLAFPTVFVFIDLTDIIVTRTVIATDISTVLAITTNYTVTGGNNSNGTVSLLVAPTAGERITIERNIPLTQELAIVENDAFPSDSVQDAFDKSTLLLQQVSEKQSRALTVPASSLLSPAVFLQTFITAAATATAQAVIATAQAVIATAQKVIATDQAAIATAQAVIATSGVMNINGLTESAADGDSDWIPFFDVSASVNRKTLIQDLLRSLAALGSINTNQTIDLASRALSHLVTATLTGPVIFTLSNPREGQMVTLRATASGGARNFSFLNNTDYLVQNDEYAPATGESIPSGQTWIYTCLYMGGIWNINRGKNYA